MFMAPGKAGYAGGLSYWILDNARFSMMLAEPLPSADESAPVSFDVGSADFAPAIGREENGLAAVSADRLAELRLRVGSLRILNGGGESGLGKRAADIFQRIGIEVPYTGNARHYDYHTTNIIYPPDGGEAARDAALALAELCGITNQGLIRADRRAASLTLILGHDKEDVFRRLEPAP